jgi:K+-sensing histidine kinase KdpD
MNKKEGAFDPQDEKLLAAFSAQAAVAIENSRLFQFTEKALNHALADQRNLKFMLSVTKNLFSDMHLTSMIDQMTMQVYHHITLYHTIVMHHVDMVVRLIYSCQRIGSSSTEGR